MRAKLLRYHNRRATRLQPARLWRYDSHFRRCLKYTSSAPSIRSQSTHTTATPFRQEEPPLHPIQPLPAHCTTTSETVVYIDCYKGADFIIDVTLPELSACWETGGVVAGGLYSCGNPDSNGFCRDANQTALNQILVDEHLRNTTYPLVCRSSAAPPAVKAGGMLLLVALAVVVPIIA
ncbi:hypothetical protein ANO11243_089130 [Dothideomycetidae sp. 11243]|nr:hypothetical protein ANO11243_089130 [fungal sp. No.11243]